MGRPIRFLVLSLALCCALLGLFPSAVDAAPLAQSCQVYTLGADWISVTVAVPSTLQAPAGVEYRPSGSAFAYVVPSGGLVELAAGSYQMRNFTGTASAQICTLSGTPPPMTATPVGPGGCAVLASGSTPVGPGSGPAVVVTVPDEYDYVRVRASTSNRTLNLYVTQDGVFVPPQYALFQEWSVTYQTPGSGWQVRVGDSRSVSLTVYLYVEGCRDGPTPTPYTPVPTFTAAPATMVSPSCAQFDTPATVYLGAANTVRAVRGPVWFVDHGLFDERVYLDSTARFWVAGYGQQAGYVTLEGVGGIAEVCEQYPAQVTGTATRTATASPTAINPFPTRTPTPTRTRTPTRTPTPSRTPTGSPPPTNTLPPTGTSTSTSTPLPTSTPHPDCVANPLDPGCMLQTVVAVPSAIVTPSPGWAVPTARPTMGPGAVSTALAGKEPFSSFEAGSDLVRDLGFILETAPEGCSLDVLSGIDQVSPWAPPMGARFDVPTPAQMAPAVCWLYDQWLPFFQIIRALSLFAWMWGFFLYLRRRIAAFGQAGGE